MAPPTYGDLGKHARDIFGKGFHFGVVKLDVKTKTSSGVEFTKGCVANHETGKISGSLEGKYLLNDYNTTVTAAWNTANVISSQIELEDFLVKGLKVSVDSTYNLPTNTKDGKISAEYHHSLVNLAGDVDLNLQGGPLVNASAVLGHGPYTVGYQIAYDSAKSKLTKNNVGLSMAGNDYVFFANVNDGQVFGSSVFKKLSPELECGFTLGWTASANTTSIGVGTKYQIDETSCVRAKLNNSRQVGLGYQQKISDGISLTLSTLIDGKNFNQGGHKVGLSLEFQTQ